MSTSSLQADPLAIATALNTDVPIIAPPAGYLEGVVLVTRVFAVFIAAIAVQYVVEGTKRFFV
jgi:hypothetical protein